MDLEKCCGCCQWFRYNDDGGFGNFGRCFNPRVNILIAQLADSCGENCSNFSKRNKGINKVLSCTYNN